MYHVVPYWKITVQLTSRNFAILSNFMPNIPRQITKCTGKSPATFCLSHVNRRMTLWEWAGRVVINRISVWPCYTPILYKNMRSSEISKNGELPFGVHLPKEQKLIDFVSTGEYEKKKLYGFNFFPKRYHLLSVVCRYKSIKMSD